MKSYRGTSTGPLLRFDRLRAQAEEVIRGYEVKAPGPGTAHILDALERASPSS